MQLNSRWGERKLEGGYRPWCFRNFGDTHRDMVHHHGFSLVRVFEGVVEAMPITDVWSERRRFRNQPLVCGKPHDAFGGVQSVFVCGSVERDTAVTHVLDGARFCVISPASNSAPIPRAEQ